MNNLAHQVNNVESDPLALYIHVPFCLRKCGYCSFVSYEGRNSDIEKYVQALKHELAHRLHGDNISTVYLGGGTPSLLSIKQVGEILETVNLFSVITGRAEITMEVNPGTVDEQYLSTLRILGVNRLSLGIQSFNDTELSVLGRVHNAEQALSAIDIARRVGFDNLNLDIIYGIPGQSSESFRNTLQELVKANPQHISLYSLTLEENTPLWNSINNGEIQSLDADLAAEQYEMAENMLGEAGYSHYEISNWAKEDFRCRHNLVYWLCQPYIGAGAAAHSYIAGHRLSNTCDLDKYIKYYSRVNSFPEEIFELNEEIKPDLQLAEAIILGLRLCEGVNIDAFKEKFQVNLINHYNKPIEEMIETGLLEHSGRNLRLTSRGRLLGNEVFLRFLPG